MGLATSIPDELNISATTGSPESLSATNEKLLMGWANWRRISFWKVSPPVGPPKTLLGSPSSLDPIDNGVAVYKTEGNEVPGEGRSPGEERVMYESVTPGIALEILVPTG